MVGGMMDELVRKLIIYPDPDFQKLLVDLEADDDAVADAASVMCLHILHPGARVPDDLPRAAVELTDWMQVKRR
jgi:hypothetical protein